MNPDTQHQQALLTRKEAASMLGISLRSFDRNAERLGLKRARIQINPRVVRFHPEDIRSAINHLRALALTGSK